MSERAAPPYARMENNENLFAIAARNHQKEPATQSKRTSSGS